MNRLKKELSKRGIISAPYNGYNDFDLYDSDYELVSIEKNIIIVIMYSSVLPDIFYIFDTNYNLLGSQEKIKSNTHAKNPWACYTNYIM